MRIDRRVAFWVAALLTLLILLSVFSSILLPFVAGAALAYLLDPLADWFERQGFSRLAATMTILVLFIGADRADASGAADPDQPADPAAENVPFTSSNGWTC
jgi:hypothetical protein